MAMDRGKWFIGMAVSMLIGLSAYAISRLTHAHMADPLLIALILGIFVKAVIGDRKEIASGIKVAPRVLIPLGIVFYGMKNLNFIKFSSMDPRILLVLLLVVVVYLAVIIYLGKRLGQKKEITYLTATGSAICGASAIAITSPALEAEPDDISISLLSVALAAFLGVFIIIPMLATGLDLTNKIYGLLSASVLQFTGFVKAAVDREMFLTAEISRLSMISMATSVKAARYLGLLITIPLFASFNKKKAHLPAALWAFLLAGIAGTLIYRISNTFYSEALIPRIKPVYNVLWAVAMAAIGLNVDMKVLLTDNGIKAMIMAVAGFAGAILTFFVGMRLFGI